MKLLWAWARATRQVEWNSIKFVWPSLPTFDPNLYSHFTTPLHADSGGWWRYSIGIRWVEMSNWKLIAELWSFRRFQIHFGELNALTRFDLSHFIITSGTMHRSLYRFFIWNDVVAIKCQFKYAEYDDSCQFCKFAKSNASANDNFDSRQRPRRAKKDFLIKISQMALTNAATIPMPCHAIGATQVERSIVLM